MSGSQSGILRQLLEERHSSSPWRVPSPLELRAHRSSRPRSTYLATKDDWILSIPPKNLSAFLIDDGAWKKVRAIGEVGEAEVWDLQVEGDESFVAEGCAVHNCPLQLDIVDRVVRLHSNPGDTVFSPFAGIGSEGFAALRAGRRFVGIELKPEYYRWAIRNLEGACKQSAFSFIDTQPPAPPADTAPPAPPETPPARAATARREPLADASGVGQGLREAARPRRELEAPKRLTIILTDGTEVHP